MQRVEGTEGFVEEFTLSLEPETQVQGHKSMQRSRGYETFPLSLEERLRLV